MNSSRIRLIVAQGIAGYECEKKFKDYWDEITSEERLDALEKARVVLTYMANNDLLIIES